MATGCKHNRYFITKCDTFENLITCQESKIWAVSKHEKSAAQPRDKLLSAFNDSQEVVIIFSVNGSKGWQGYSRLLTPPSDTAVTKEGSTDEWYKFEVEWKVTFAGRNRNGLAFVSTEQLLYNDGVLEKSINKARNWDEVELSVGEQLCKMMDGEYQLSLEDSKKLEIHKLGHDNPVFFKLSDQESANTSWSILWERLSSHVKDHGKIMLACPFGSHRYNLDTPTSDLDMFVVYIGDTKKCLSFHPPPTTIKNRTSEQPDFTIYELYRYCELLVSGDPRVVESLFLNAGTIHYATKEYYELVKLREFVLSREVVKKYMSDACGGHGLKLLKQMLGQKMAPNVDKVYKVLYIVLRLLLHARQIALCVEFSVFLEDASEDRKFLLLIRKHECSFQEAMERIETVKTEIETVMGSESFGLRNKSCQEPIEEWMLGVRRENMLADIPLI